MNQDQISRNSSGAQHVALSDPSWALWRWSVLRGAGFAVDRPLQLADPTCAAAADQLLADEQAAQQSQAALIALLNSIMDAAPTQRVFFANIIQSLHKGKLPTSQDLPPAVQTAVAALQAARARTEASRASYQQTFAAALVRTTERLQALIAQPDFRLALAWQNRQALHTAVAPFLAKPATTSSSQYRQHRLLLTKYLQRYCLKNDTIGFFGPVGWARWEPEEPASQVQPGPNLIAERTTYVEGWGVNALAQTLAANPAVRPWAVPRLMPFAHLEGQTLHLPFVKPLALSVAQARVLAACDGTRTAQHLAHRLVGQGIPGLATEAAVYAVLEQVLASRRIQWGFEVPPEDPYPLRSLRQRVGAIEPQALRQAALASVAQMEQAVAQVSQAGTDAEAVEAAIGQVEATFTALTEQSSIRSAGKLYAGRTLVYEDARRDVRVQLGGDLLAGMQRPLAGLLTSARWLAHHLAAECHQQLYQVYAGLVAKSGNSIVEFTQFFPLVNSELFEENMMPAQKLIEPALTQFQQKWAEVLGLPRAERQLTYTSAEIEARLYATFEAAGPGWPLGHYHCPDVMLDARDVAAINRGDFQYVMGELHLGMNTFDAPLFVQQHPQREELFQAIAVDLPAPRIIPAFSSQFLPATRIHQILALPKDYRLVTVPEVCDAPPARTLRMGDLVVEELAGDLVVRTRDGQQRYAIMQFMGDYYSLAVGDTFTVLASGSHTPRITIDRMVVTREAWRLRGDEVPFTQINDQAECFAQVRAWAQAHGMPRFLFYRTPKEKKPCYLDLASPLSVELFVKDVRRMVNGDPTDGFIASLSEMIPDPDHAWLIDAQGNHYTSEIRMAAVDQRE